MISIPLGLFSCCEKTCLVLISRSRSLCLLNLRAALVTRSWSFATCLFELLAEQSGKPMHLPLPFSAGCQRDLSEWVQGGNHKIEGEGRWTTCSTRETHICNKKPCNTLLPARQLCSYYSTQKMLSSFRITILKFNTGEELKEERGGGRRNKGWGEGEAGKSKMRSARAVSIFRSTGK